jgi:hypothetical protein
MLGQRDEAFKVIDALQVRIPGSVAPWIVQAWALWKADLLYLLDRKEMALELARSTLKDHGLELRTPAFAGPYARWMALTARSNQEKDSAADKVERLLAQLERYDAIDQVDILCAAALLSTSPFGHRQAAMQRLSRLPSALGTHLISLGLMQTQRISS